MQRKTNRDRLGKADRRRNMISQGDIIRLDLDPQAGHEQRGRRPALVISNNLFNRYSRMYMICPITQTDKKHAFHNTVGRQDKYEQCYPL